MKHVSLTFLMRMITSFNYSIILDKTETSLAIKLGTAACIVATYTVFSCSFLSMQLLLAKHSFLPTSLLPHREKRNVEIIAAEIERINY